MIGQSPQFSVSDFVAVFNQTLEFTYPEVEIVGELANFRISKNAWVYFDLKDEISSLKFFGSVRSLPGPLEDGMMLKVVARPYLHPKFNFSMQLSAVGVTGEGAINKAFILLKQKLEKEGLFSVERKRAIPYPPSSVYLIASKESAGYSDFHKIIKHRWPRLKIVDLNVAVQGNDAPGEIAEALSKANQASEAEVVVLLRGGGSKDDLSSFDHEIVVRAVAQSRLVTMVAIGHERDVCLAELAADKRASTPSNAAELLVPDRHAEIKSIKIISDQLNSLVKNYSQRISREISEYSQTIDQQLSLIYSNAKSYLEQSSKLLTAYDPKRPLKIGFSLAIDSNGRAIRSKASAIRASEFNLSFNDGKIEVKVKDGIKNG